MSGQKRARKREREYYVVVSLRLEDTKAGKARHREGVTYTNIMIALAICVFRLKAIAFIDVISRVNLVGSIVGVIVRWRKRN